MLLCEIKAIWIKSYKQCNFVSDCERRKPDKRLTIGTWRRLTKESTVTSASCRKLTTYASAVGLDLQRLCGGVRHLYLTLPLNWCEFAVCPHTLINSIGGVDGVINNNNNKIIFINRQFLTRRNMEHQHPLQWRECDREIQWSFVCIDCDVRVSN